MDDAVKTLVEEEYGLKVYDCEENGNRTILRTERGIVYLYSCPAAYRFKGKFVERTRKHLLQHSQFGMLPVLETRNGESYVVLNEEMYVLQNGIREAVPTDLPFATGQALAQFHQGTSSFTGNRWFLPYSSLGSWPGMWRKRLRKLSAYRDDLEQERGEITPFDEYILTTYTYVNHMGDVAVHYLQDACYSEVIKQTAAFGKVAYQNFGEGNILFGEDGTRFLGGEWCWVLDMRARDIGQWIKAEIRQNGWQEDTVARFLDGYNSCTPLLCEEYGVIYALLLYPGRFLKLVEAYSNLTPLDRRDPEFAMWPAELDEELLAMEEAWRAFPKLVLDRYGAALPHIEWLWDVCERPAESTSACDAASSS